MKNLIIGVVLVAALASGVFYFNSTKKMPENTEHVLVYQQARNLNPFSLVAHTGESFTNEQMQGHWSFAFLGYTHCPDICPTTLQELNFVYPELKKVADNSRVLLLTADPRRDSIERLNEYIQYFNKEFVALRGEHDALFPFTRNLGLMYAIADDLTQSAYLVDHSASIVLINPAGKITAIFKAEIAPGSVPAVNMDTLLAAFKQIVANY